MPFDGATLRRAPPRHAYLREWLPRLHLLWSRRGLRNGCGRFQDECCKHGREGRHEKTAAATAAVKADRKHVTPGGDKRPVTAILADEVRFRPYADCTTTGLDSPGHPARRARAWPLPVADLLARGSLSPAAFPGASLPVALWPDTRRLQLRGQPRHCVRHLHAHAPRSLL